MTISSNLYEKLGYQDNNNIIYACNISFFISLLQILGMILYKIIQKNAKINELSKRNVGFAFSSKLILHNTKQKNKKKKINILLIICSFCECIRYFFAIYQSDYKDVGYYVSGLNMSVILLISLNILRKHKYKHHYLAIILIFISDFSLTILDTEEYKTFFIEYFIIQVKHFSDFTFVPLKLCLEKYLMYFLFLNGYKILFIEGIIQSLIYSFVFIIFIFFSNNFFIEQKLFFNHFSDNLFYYIIFLFSFLFAKIFEILINDVFEPNYIILGSCSFVIMKPIQIIFLNDKKYSILKNLSYIITYLMYLLAVNLMYLLAVMIFSEVIILNIFNLEINTRKYIEIRTLQNTILKSDNTLNSQFNENINDRISNNIFNNTIIL